MIMLTRREMLMVSAFSIASLRAADAISKDTNSSASEYADSMAADKWVQQSAQEKREVVGAFYLMRFADPFYVVTKEIAWKPNPPQAADYRAVTVPVGFVTDFASIPRVFWSVLRPDGDYAYAAVIHDYLYWEQSIPRKTADEILRFAMQDLHVKSAEISVIYDGVRLGGGIAWDKNAKLKSSGEKRVIKRLPEDPTIRWRDWKERKNSF